MINYDVFRSEPEDKEPNKEEQLDVWFWCIFLPQIKLRVLVSHIIVSEFSFFCILLIFIPKNQ